MSRLHRLRQMSRRAAGDAGGCGKITAAEIKSG